MSFFGLMILIHPAVFCLVMGISLLILGMVWLIVIRRFSKKSTKIVTGLSVFLLSLAAFTLSIYLKSGLLPVYFEVISPLPYSSAD